MNANGIVLGEKIRIRPNGGGILEGFHPEDWGVQGLRDGSCVATYRVRGTKFVVELDDEGYSARVVIDGENMALDLAEVETLGCQAITAAVLNLNAPEWAPSPFETSMQPS